jgi:hypothetical protein
VFLKIRLGDFHEDVQGNAVKSEATNLSERLGTFGIEEHYFVYAQSTAAHYYQYINDLENRIF